MLRQREHLVGPTAGYKDGKNGEYDRHEPNVQTLKREKSTPGKSFILERVLTFKTRKGRYHQ